MSDVNKPQDDSKIQIDADWKAQARAEKEKLAQEVGSAPEAAQGQLPPADFKTLMSTLISQALMYMGAPDPATGRGMVHLDAARFHIDLLGVLEDKTKGNLDAEEQEMLTGAVAELRQYFVQVSQQVSAQLAAQRAKQGQAGAGAPKPGPAGPQGGGAKPGGGIIMP